MHYTEVLDSLLFERRPYSKKERATMADNLGITGGRFIGAIPGAVIGGSIGNMAGATGGGGEKSKLIRAAVGSIIGAYGGQYVGGLAGEHLGKTASNAYFEGSKNKKDEWRKLRNMAMINAGAAGATGGALLNYGLEYMHNKHNSKIPFAQNKTVLPILAGAGLAYMADRAYKRFEKQGVKKR